MLGKCRQIYCSKKRILDASKRKCDVIFQSAKGLAYDLQISLNSTKPYDIGSSINQWLTDTAYQIKDVFESKLETSIIKYDMFRVRLFTKQNETFLYQLIFRTKFIVLSEMSLESLEKRLISASRSVWVVKVRQVEIDLMSSPVLIAEAEPDVGKRIVMHEARIFIPIRVLLPYVKKKTYVYSVVSKTLECPFVYVTQSEYYIDKSRLILSASNTTVEPDLFALQENNSVIICYEVIAYVPPSSQYVSPYDIFSTEFILVSWVCQSLSLFCLLVTLLVFCLFSSLRTLPGKNTMGLILTLICALTLQTFGIARVELNVVCRAIGICFHFFLLSSFTWMLICTVHMFRVFRKMLSSRTTRSDEHQQFLTYVCISLSVPACIVVITIMVNIIITKGIDLGYGNGICYISNFYGVIGGLLVPVIFVMVVNIVLFISTVMALRGMTSDNSDLIGKKSYLSVYVKMSTLTGINWMFAFVAAATNLETLWYIFTILCGLQGVYIFVSFVCNKRVIRLFKESCGMKKGQGMGTSNKTMSSPMSPQDGSQSEVVVASLATSNLTTESNYLNNINLSRL
ncbi:adhesion G protein-coupled receptor L3-like [Gigantopelta aegis]|uniref:adhesion G protein-coupled receptor L3-like n=1 Tax=Gigantopelta aegis TaxID=1735272 RepID=UPI001B88B3E1|nr:adhesion G protein-coupled receptor L3-like [Gigantopelta aegis]